MNARFMAADLKKADPDRYLLSLFYPPEVRERLWALFLLNHEIERTRSVVSDTRLGLIRLQWWRDEIVRVYDGGSGGEIPVLSTLAPPIHAQILPQADFEALLYAREFDLEDVAPANWEGARNYADFTTTPLNRLALKIAGENAIDAEIRQISTNFGLMRAIRGVPLMLAERRFYLPQDWLTEKSLSVQKISDFNHQSDIVSVVQRAVLLIESYRKPDSRLLKLMQRMTSIYLKQIAKAGYDPFSAKVQAEPPFLALRLWWSQFSGS